MSIAAEKLPLPHRHRGSAAMDISELTHVE
jgi:hypothetical protein